MAKRRRGGKHRNKGLAAAEAATEGLAEAAPEGEAAIQSQADGAADGVSDSLEHLQLERLDSNGAAGNVMTYLLSGILYKTCFAITFLKR